MADTHKFVGNHAAEVAGVMRGPGESFSLDAEQLEDVHVKDMLDNNLLMTLSGGESKKEGDK